MSDDHEVHERLARIETRMDHMEAMSVGRDAKLDTVLQELKDIDQEFSRYRGVVGGILLVVTAVVSFFKLFWDDLIEKFK